MDNLKYSSLMSSDPNLPQQNAPQRGAALQNQFSGPGQAAGSFKSNKDADE